MTDHELLVSLQSPLCPACGGKKKPAQTLCGDCYHALPRHRQQRLYDRLGQGYAEAVHAALYDLGVKSPLLPFRT